MAGIGNQRCRVACHAHSQLCNRQNNIHESTDSTMKANKSEKRLYGTALASKSWVRAISHVPQQSDSISGIFVCKEV
jgi:hypothetical protein